MGFFKARITQSINMLTGRSGPLWARRYDAQAIVDDEGTAERMGYTLTSPTAAALVEDPELWPGLNLAYGMAEEDTFECLYFDRTGWHQKKRPKDITRFFRTATLTLSPIPGCTGMSRELYYESLRTWIDAAHVKQQAKRAAQHGDAGPPRRRRPLGVDRVLRASFDQRPVSRRASAGPTPSAILATSTSTTKACSASSPGSTKPPTGSGRDSSTSSSPRAPTAHR